MKQYDAIIIGFGKGGKLLAAELANRNWKVAIIERSPQMYGGTCVNVGCIPTKALIYESEQAERLYRDDYGNQAKYYALAIRRKNKLVSFLRDKNHERIKEHPNITLYDGTASFVSDDTVKVVSHDKKEILLKGKEVFMLYLEYIVLAILVVFLSVRLSYYVDCLDKKTNLSGAFIGGVMLAAVTSLPELFTSLTAVLALDQPDLVQGNVLGSNIFNLCVIGGLMLFTSRRYQRATLSKSHGKTLCFGLVMYVLVFAAIMMPQEVGFSFFRVNLMSILILLVYAVNVKFMGNDDSGDSEEQVYISLSVKQIAVRFICYSIGLVTVSILLTTVTDQLAEELQLGATVAGAIFLGVATSLPELSASVNLVRIGNFNASFGNIVGSNLFNFIILCFADVLFTRGSIYVNEVQVMNLLGFGAFSMLCALVIIYGKKNRALVLLASVAILASYVASIVLSM